MAQYMYQATMHVHCSSVGEASIEHFDANMELVRGHHTCMYKHTEWVSDRQV